MFVHNITIKISNQILQQWIAWQMQERIPEIMATKLFNEIKFYRLLEQDDNEGTTFILQYFTDDKNKFDQYIKFYDMNLRKKSFEKWKDNFVEFKTLMQAVH